MSECKDKFGNPVSVGSRVRLIELSPHFLASLSSDELDEIKSMIGGILEVYEIDNSGFAWVEMVWNEEIKGQYMSHSLGLDAHEMELVDSTL